MNHKMAVEINSHIQIPLSVIENFSYFLKTENNGHINKEKFVFVLDVKSKLIKEIRAKDYGAEHGYYSQDVEALLNESYESPLGEIKKKIITYSKHKIDEITIDKKEFIALKNYLKMLFYRNKKMYEDFLKFSKLPQESRPNVSEYIEICHKKNIDPIENLKSYSLTLLTTDSTRKFVNSFSGLGLFSSKDVSPNLLIFAPLCPEGGVLFFIPNTPNDIYMDPKIVDEKNVIEINKYICRTECELSKDSLISNCENELQELIKYHEAFK